MYWLLGQSQNYPQATNLSYIKQYSNQSGLMEYNSAHDSGRTLVCAEHGYPKGSPNANS
jgi:hypothetical protein